MVLIWMPLQFYIIKEIKVVSKFKFFIVLMCTSFFVHAAEHPLCEDIQSWRDARQGQPYWLMVVNLPELAHSSLVERDYYGWDSTLRMIDYFIQSKDQTKSRVEALSATSSATYDLDLFFSYYPQFEQHLLSSVAREGQYKYETISEKIPFDDAMYAKNNEDGEIVTVVPFISVASGFTIFEYDFERQEWFKQENSPNYYKSVNQMKVKPNAVFRLEYQSSIYLNDDGVFYSLVKNEGDWTLKAPDVKDFETEQQWQSALNQYHEAISRFEQPLEMNKYAIAQYESKSAIDLDCTLY